jgi:glycosyltransferase involved in cell wall biosynthesis
VYTRHLARRLTALGHQVTVFAGPPWPELDEGVGFVPVPNLDLYRRENPFRFPWPHELRDSIDVRELLLMAGAGYPEPYTFGLRVRRLLAERRGNFDIVHDNQCLGTGIRGLLDDGWPLVSTLHHPITVDRELDMADATSAFRRASLRRWYGFLGMQMRVARALPRHLTVSENSKRDIVDQMGVRPEQLHIVPVGVDQEQFRPLPDVAKVPGRLMTTASADMVLKGLTYLIDALAKVRVERPDAHLVVIGRPKKSSRIPGQIRQLGLEDAVEFVSGVPDERIVELYAEAEVACVPSVYEGFSLPAAEAMACGVPLAATTGGAIPEVVGTDGETGLLVPPRDPSALATAILRYLDDPELRRRIGAAGRRRVLERFTWEVTARRTAEHYYLELEEHARRQEAGALPEPSDRGAGNPARSEAWPERPGPKGRERKTC